MTQTEHELLIALALVVRSMAPPDDQRLIDRKLANLEAEGLYGAGEQVRRSEATEPVPTPSNPEGETHE